MLTKELAIAAFENGRLVPDRLNRRVHARYAGYAEDMLQIYRIGVGRSRRDLHKAVHSVFEKESDCPLRRIDAFCKLLDDASNFIGGRPGPSAALRREIFQRAAVMHPLVESADRLFTHDETTAKAEIAAQMGQSWSNLDAQLFADVMENQRLETFDGYANGAALLARYNVAQVQVAVFRATEMIVWVSADFKPILRYAKLAGLMHTIRQLNEGRYEIRLDGPASSLGSTRRYGVAMAKFLPALIACKGWRLHAVVATPRSGKLVSLDLAPADGLTSHLPPPEEFDSGVEERFAQQWGEKRDGWSLEREGEILHISQKAFMPDFVVRHDDGRKVLLEIVGFWTPAYLKAKFQTLRLFKEHRILLAVAAPASRHVSDVPPDAIHYKSSLRPKDVLQRLADL